MGLNPIGNPDFARDAANLVERYVGVVRDKGTKRIVTSARAIVFGLLGVFAAFVAAVLLLVIGMRLLQMLWAWPFDHDTSVWLSYVTIGGIFTAAGLFLMTRRHAKPAK